MKRLIFLSTIFLSPCLCSAQIAIVDNPDAPWTGKNASKVFMSTAVDVGSLADMFILDVQTYGNSTWNGCNLFLNGTPLIQATAQIPGTTPRIDTAIYYLANPPTGSSLTLSGTFATGCTAAQANYYTLSGVNTAAALITGGTIAGSTPTAGLTLTMPAGAWAAIDQATMYPGPSTGSYGATTGSPGALNSGGNSGSVFGSDGYAQNLVAGSNTLTASVDYPSATNHALSIAVFTPTIPPPYGPPTWTAGSGNWSTGGNWSSSAAPNAAGATAVLGQTGSTTAAITLDEPITLGTLTIGTTADTTGTNTVGYSLSGANGLTLSDSASGILIESGTQAIASNVAGAGSLVVDGPATLILSGTNSYTGGTEVEAGTLIVNTGSALPDGSSLVVGAGGTFIFDPSLSAAGSQFAGPDTRPAGNVGAVPEPSTFVLLFAGMVTLLFKKGRWGKGK